MMQTQEDLGFLSFIDSLNFIKSYYCFTLPAFYPKRVSEGVLAKYFNPIILITACEKITRFEV